MRNISLTIVLAISLSACGGGIGLFESGTSSAPKPSASQSTSSESTLGNLLAFGTTNPGPAPAQKPLASNDPVVSCPTISILDGTSDYRVYSGGGQSNANVHHQFSIGDVARECKVAGKELMIKVGIEGRALVGPTGTSGSYSVPLRIVIRREKDQKPETSKVYQVAATIPAGQTQGAFTVISDSLTVPFLREEADDDYTILVGFDKNGGKPERPAKKKKK